MGLRNMNLSPKDAAAALHEIEQTENRSLTLFSYRAAAPHFMIWGAIWCVAYTLTDYFPHQANAIWGILTPIGVIAGMIVTRIGRRQLQWRYLAAVIAVFGFFLAAFAVMWPVSGQQIAAFIPLFVALMYVLWGVRSGQRFVIVGVVVAALTLVGYFVLKEHFLLWMAAVGGGSLILAGIWLRRV